MSTATDSPRALVRRAKELLEAGMLSEAEAACRLALDRHPEASEAYRVLGKVYIARNDAIGAVANFEEAAHLDPENAKIFKQLGVALAVQGRFEDAATALRRALELRPGYAAALCHLARLKHFESEDDPDLLALEENTREDTHAPEEVAMLNFTLARAYEDLGDYERAFASLRRANRFKRETLAYDVEEDIAFLERVAEVFSEDLLERFSGSGSDSELPLLVVGMPRSGTSLVEQILASHPAVHGAGELANLSELTRIASALSSRSSPFPESVTQLRPDDLRRFGATYVEWLRALAPDAARVVDKNPLNFRYLGFLRLILPRARVVHCVRDAVDTCMSCYGLDFHSLPFSYDLRDLGRFYRAYAELMEHWRERLPPDSILEVRYEDLVGDLEAHARRLVAHAGLEWDPACLEFHSVERTVRTLSFTQVRKPVYRTSVGRSQRYTEHLAPLHEALGGRLPATAD